MTTIENVKKLEAELCKQRDAAKNELFKQIEDCLAQLREIGCDYKLTENGQAPAKKERVCSECRKPGHTKATCPTIKK